MKNQFISSNVLRKDLNQVQVIIRPDKQFRVDPMLAWKLAFVDLDVNEKKMVTQRAASKLDAYVRIVKIDWSFFLASLEIVEIVRFPDGGGT